MNDSKKQKARSKKWLTTTTTFLLLYPLLLAPRSSLQSAWNPEQEKVVKDYGEKAMNYFYQGDYSQAIYMWQEILKIDPSQTQPDKLIKQARAKLQEKLKPLFESFYSSVKKGKYTEAQGVTSQILTLDPANSDVRGLSSRLDDVVKISPEILTLGRVPDLIRLGISKYLKTNPDIKMAFNSLRYAQNLEPTNRTVKSLLNYLEEHHPEESKITFPNLGKDIVEHKLALALTHFYQGRFDLTIQECKEILELEPGNKVALSRLGSGYYALGQKTKAKDYWQQALKVDPNNRKLQKMVASINK